MIGIREQCLALRATVDLSVNMSLCGGSDGAESGRMLPPSLPSKVRWTVVYKRKRKKKPRCLVLGKVINKF